MHCIGLTSLCITLVMTSAMVADDRSPKALLELDVRAMAIALSPDGRFLAVAQTDKSVWLFNRADGKSLGEVGQLPVPVTALAFSPDGRLLAAAGCSGTRPGSFELRQFRVDDKEVAYEVTEPNHRDEGDGAEAFAFLAFSPDSKFLAHPAKDRTVVVYDLDQCQVKHSFPLGLVPSAVAFSRKGMTLALGTDTGGAHGAVYHVDLETGKGLPTKSTLYSGVLALAFLPDGKHLLGGHRDWLYRLDIATGKYDLVLKEDSHWKASALAFSPLADRVAIINGKELQLRETESGKILRHWPLASGALAWSYDGREIVTATEDGKVRIWDVPAAATKAHE